MFVAHVVIVRASEERSLLQIKCKIREDLHYFMPPQRSRSSVLGKKAWLFTNVRSRKIVKK